MPELIAPEGDRLAGVAAVLCPALRCGDVVYLEGRHVESRTPAQYLGVWDSVNDVRVQLGEARWGTFMEFVAARVDGMTRIDTTYRTRAWSAARL